MPAELDEQRRKILQMQIEEAALKKETDNLSRERLETLQKELAELKDTFNSAKHSGKMKRVPLRNCPNCVSRSRT